MIKNVFTIKKNKNVVSYVDQSLLIQQKFVILQTITAFTKIINVFLKA